MPARSGVLSLGVFLIVLTVYAIAGPGRIDIIDGQYRFEVAKNMIEDRSIQIMDPFLSFGAQGIDGVYSPYGISGSIVALPLVALGSLGSPSVDRQQFFFSFTSAVLGAATAVVLFLFYLRLGVSPRSALAWTLVAAFATLAFPAATSVFDQTQHGFFVLTACMLAFLAAREESTRLAIAGGLILAILVNFQETYVILFPGLALATLAPPDADPDARRRSRERYVAFILVGCLGVLFWMGLNNFRFGRLLYSRDPGNHPSVVGNPLLGLAGLLLSPGKSIFLYSPPTAAALIGVYHLFRRERMLATAIAITCLAYLALISSVSFYGGDWCWGPRYFASILPLLALGFPFLNLATRAERFALRTLIAAGIVVQLMAISVDHHRFFYARSLPAFFWYRNDAFYYRQSALFARPREIVDTITRGVPPEAKAFRPGPHPDLLTYAIFGGWGRPELPLPIWMRHYTVFWLPRPWPLWMATIPPDRRPIDVRAGLGLLIAGAFAGMIAIRYGCRPEEVKERSMSA